MSSARGGELRRRSPLAAGWSSASTVLHAVVLVLCKVSPLRITPLSFTFLFFFTSIAMAFPVSLAFFASPPSFTVHPRPTAMDSPIRGMELVDLRGEPPFLTPITRSTLLPSASPIATAAYAPLFPVPLRKLILFPELVGAFKSCQRTAPAIALPMAALPEPLGCCFRLNHLNTNGSWISLPQVHHRPPTEVSKCSMSSPAEDPGPALDPRIHLRVQHADSEILGGQVYTRRIKIDKVYYISRPRSFNLIRFGSGGASSSVRVDRRFLSKKVLRFDARRSEAIFLSPVMLIQNLRLKMFNPLRHRPVRQSRERGLYCRSAIWRTLDVSVVARHWPSAPNGDVTHV